MVDKKINNIMKKFNEFQISEVRTYVKEDPKVGSKSTMPPPPQRKHDISIPKIDGIIFTEEEKELINSALEYYDKNHGLRSRNIEILEDIKDKIK